jgi:hypothetical protein
LSNGKKAVPQGKSDEKLEKMLLGIYETILFSGVEFDP